MRQERCQESHHTAMDVVQQLLPQASSNPPPETHSYQRKRITQSSSPTQRPSLLGGLKRSAGTIPSLKEGPSPSPVAILSAAYPSCGNPLHQNTLTVQAKKGAKAFTMSPTAAAGNRSASFSRHLFPHPQSASLPAQALSCQEVQGHTQNSTAPAASISQLHGTCGAGADEEAGTSPR